MRGQGGRCRGSWALRVGRTQRGWASFHGQRSVSKYEQKGAQGLGDREAIPETRGCTLEQLTKNLELPPQGGVPPLPDLRGPGHLCPAASILRASQCCTSGGAQGLQATHCGDCGEGGKLAKLRLPLPQRRKRRVSLRGQSRSSRAGKCRENAWPDTSLVPMGPTEDGGWG